MVFGVSEEASVLRTERVIISPRGGSLSEGWQGGTTGELIKPIWKVVYAKNDRGKNAIYSVDRSLASPGAANFNSHILLSSASRSMENLNRLQAAQDALLEEYRTNLEDIYNIQDTLIQDILPSVADNLDLTPDACAWAKEWLSDTCAPS